MPSIYRPLDANRHEIRLLKLLPEPEAGFSSPIQCELLYRYIDDIEPYEALTYFWGDKTELHPIEVDGKPIGITANLEIALRHLRLSKEARILWVDALCINQDDTAERSHQVSLMRDVYQRCRRDIAWLGPLSGGAHFVRSGLYPDEAGQVTYEDHVRNGMELMKRMRLQDLKDGSLSGNPGLESMASGKHKHKLQWHQVCSLEAIFEEPKIWERVWVMQELSCAPEVTLAYARQTLDWAVVSAFLDNRTYADAFHMPQSHGSTSPITNMMSAVLSIEHQRHIMRDVDTKGYQATLLDVLARFKNVYSTDPRDRVYGLLGLVTEQHGIRADYSKPAQRVFGEVAVYLIRSLENLDIICQNPWTKDTHTPGLASWIPDFADEAYSKDDARTGFSRLLFAQRSIFSAGRPKCHLPIKVERHSDKWKIRLKGAAIGKLGRVLHEECHAESFKGYDMALRVPRAWMLLYFGTELLDSGKDSREIKDFWRALVMDCDAYPMKRLSDELVANEHPAWDFILRHDGPEAEKPRERFRELACRNSLGAGTESMWYRNRYGWTFCLSDKGLYLMVRRGAREGDIIAVLDGGKVPVILREVPTKDGADTEYVVVCVAYVHGFMDGEAVKMCEEGRLTEQEFLIA